MNKTNLTIIALVNKAGNATDKTLTQMMELGKSSVDSFRADPNNREDINESIQNLSNFEFKPSKFGEQKSTMIFINNALYVFILHRQNYYDNMPKEKKNVFWEEITWFYMTYALASVYCLNSQKATMSEIGQAIAELRSHFLSQFLPIYSDYFF